MYTHTYMLCYIYIYIFFFQMKKTLQKAFCTQTRTLFMTLFLWEPCSKCSTTRSKVLLIGTAHRTLPSVELTVQEKRLACKRYEEMREELGGVKDRNEREIQNLKEHLRLAMAALQEGQNLGNSLDH